MPEPCAASSWDAVVCVQENLQRGGYLIEVGAREAAPGHSIPRLVELAADREPELYTGFEEQYGALAGLAARRAGVTARVVVGYIADEDQSPSSIEMTAESIDVWLEVLTDQGWVSVDVTPDRENEPQLNNPGRSTQPITDQIPPVPPPPPALVDNQNVDEQEELEEEEEEEEEGGPRSLVERAVIAAIASLAVPVVAGAVWLAAMGLLKARRSNRRRNSANPSHRVAGAWYDSLDRLAESGHSPDSGLSTSEFAEIIDLRFEGATQMSELAALVDAAAFGPNEVDSETSERAWKRHDQTCDVLNKRGSRTDTLRRLADPSPLFKGDPVPYDTSATRSKPEQIPVGDMS